MRLFLAKLHMRWGPGVEEDVTLLLDHILANADSVTCSHLIQEATHLMDQNDGKIKNGGFGGHERD
jgi:hypothetical protein